MSTAEQKRLEETANREKHWRRWGPYLSDRQWGTVREDYSADGDAWNYVTYEMSRSYAYRWGEDGIAGISDNHQRLCFALALWNGRDPHLKERLFGLTGSQGNHGEDVKECYWHVDNTPTHSYMKFLYRYPQQAFPYEELVDESNRRTREDPEQELSDTEVLEENAFFDIEVEYAKASPEDIVIRILVTNRASHDAECHLLPTLWFRNDWTWSAGDVKPSIVPEGPTIVRATHPSLGTRFFELQDPCEFIFTENETNYERLFQGENAGPYVKDAFHRYVIEQDAMAISRIGGTKCACYYRKHLEPGASSEVTLRLYDERHRSGRDADEILHERKQEADVFYGGFLSHSHPGAKQLFRAASAGMLWSKQWYHYDVETWLKGDPTMPAPPEERLRGRNRGWPHLYNDDVLSMPDKWEYPWYAVWDSAFHAITLALVDPEYAKRQLTLFTREWYMHPNGQLPAYEWSFSDVNPPVHAWATWQVYQLEKDRGRCDKDFLESVYHKLLMNFTWWVNRKDVDGNNVFEGGFLGLDNIGVFDRSSEPPAGGRLIQSDGTSWMAMYCLNMLRIAWELAETDPAYEDIASKFYEHFLHISHAMTNLTGKGHALWDEEDGFFYDQIQYPDGRVEPIRIRSLVGLIPLLAVEIIDHEKVARFKGFTRRMDWFNENRPDLTRNITCVFQPEHGGRCILSLATQDQLRRILRVMLDENEFLSDYGIRSLSRWHKNNPYTYETDGYSSTVMYEPGESTSPLFGGNSNWRGPIWFPMNYLLIQSLRRYDSFLGDDFKVEFPTGSGHEVTLGEVADALSVRLVSIFVEEEDGSRPVFGRSERFRQDPLWSKHPLFYEYFDGDTGKGLGASHQTGWTGLVANLIDELDRG